MLFLVFLFGPWSPSEKGVRKISRKCPRRQPQSKKRAQTEQARGLNKSSVQQLSLLEGKLSQNTKNIKLNMFVHLFFKVSTSTCMYHYGSVLLFYFSWFKLSLIQSHGAGSGTQAEQHSSPWPRTTFPCLPSPPLCAFSLIWGRSPMFLSVFLSVRQQKPDTRIAERGFPEKFDFKTSFAHMILTVWKEKQNKLWERVSLKNCLLSVLS